MPARPLALALFPALLLLTGCTTPSAPAPATASASVHNDLTAVTVTSGADKAPTVSIASPLSVTATEKKVLTTGGGPAAALGKRVTIDYVGYNGTDGKAFDSSYGSKPRSFLLSPTGNIKGLVHALVGVPTGSRIVVAIPPADAYGLEGRPTAGIGPTDTIVLVVDLRAVRDVLARATGTPVPPKAGLPTVTLGDKGAPKITVPKTAPPAQLVVQPLIAGKGAKVAKGQQITVHYTGVLWPGGKQFDSSWGRAPSTFEIGTGNVLAGWDQGLIGQAVGSQILLVVPPDDGYGAAGRPDVGISGTDDLVFVVDILDAA